MFDHLVPRRLNHLAAAFNVSPATIVNVLVLVTVNVNGMNPSPERGPSVLKIIHAIAPSKIPTRDCPRKNGVL
jgi:hypothetical protein